MKQIYKLKFPYATTISNYTNQSSTTLKNLKSLILKIGHNTPRKPTCLFEKSSRSEISPRAYELQLHTGVAAPGQRLLPPLRRKGVSMMAVRRAWQLFVRPRPARETRVLPPEDQPLSSWGCGHPLARSKSCKPTLSPLPLPFYPGCSSSAIVTAPTEAAETSFN